MLRLLPTQKKGQNAHKVSLVFTFRIFIYSGIRFLNLWIAGARSFAIRTPRLPATHNSARKEQSFDMV